MVERLRDDVVIRDRHGAVRRIRLMVHGEPVAQGSKRSLGPGRPWIEDNKEKLEAWREQIASICMRARMEADLPFLMGPVRVFLSFYMKRPKKHYRTGRHAEDLRDDAPDYHSTPPDADKLSRAVLDALVKGGLIADDGQVSVLIAEKRYAPSPGLKIELHPL